MLRPLIATLSLMLIFSGALLFAASPAFAATQQIFDWQFNETSGTVAHDSSGNGYDGTIYGSPTFLGGNGFGFNGVNQYVETINPVSNSLGVSNQAYTLTAEVQVAATSESGNIIHVANAQNGVGWCIPMLGIDSGYFRAYGWTGSQVFATDPVAAVPGQWYTIANTFDPSVGYLDLYVNDVLVASSSMGNFSASGVPDYIFAAFSPDACSGDLGFFAGDIKNVTIDSNALTQNDVNQLNGPTPAFTPADNATGVATSTNLTLAFGSDPIATSTGNINLWKTADNSLVASIPLSNLTVTQTNPYTFTVNPDVALLQGTGYYVTIASTSFEDASTTAFYSGATTGTAWTFTTGYFTPPVISNVIASANASTSAVTWTTNDLTSSRLIYGLSASYGSTTAETDTSPRVTSHSILLTGLPSCTLYHYAVVSDDSSLNTSTSTDTTFTTACPGNAAPSAQTSDSVAVASATTTTLVAGGDAIAVSTPANFTATSSSVTIQIKSLPSDTVLDSIGTPADNLSSAASVVFDVTALINNTTVLDSFNSPVTISYTYTNAGVTGLNINSLAMYHYHDGAWLSLNNCSINTTTDTLTCTTPSFSTFAIFGTALPVQSNSSSPVFASGGGGSVQSEVATLIAAGDQSDAETLIKQWPWLFPSPVASVSTVSTTSVTATTTLTEITATANLDLQEGMSDVRVLNLQKFLVMAKSGPAAQALSANGLTHYFGPLTKAALAEYQKINGISPASGYFGPITRAEMKSAGLTAI